MTGQELALMIENGITNDGEREMMGHSLFYYCCGKDPTPVLAFGGKYPLYVYADIVDYGAGSFDRETKELYERIEGNGFVLADACEIKPPKRMKKVPRIGVTQWRDLQGETFWMIYAAGDANEVFSLLYSDERGSTILPKCMCNIKYELTAQSRFYDYEYLSGIANRAEFVMGYSYSEKYRRIGTYPYYGDYGKEDDRVDLFRRMYYYYE